MTSQMRTWAERFLEIAVGLLALFISGLTLWMCINAFVEPDGGTASGFVLWSIIAFLAGIAVALAIFGVRLIIPRLRLSGRYVIGVRGLLAFVYFYGLALLVGILKGGAADGRVIVALAMLFGVGSVVYDRLKAGAAP